MRYFLLFALPLMLAAQSAESDQRITQALISEIQQLRLAIERSTLLNARTQLALSQLQIQETAAARVKQQVDELRTQAVGMNGHKVRLTESIKELEQWRTQTTDAQRILQFEGQIKETKLELEQANAMEQNRAAREGELAAQLQAAQNQVSDSRSRIAEMERALDAAIQQMLKK